MAFNLNTVAVCVIASVVLLNVSPCNCSKNHCGGPSGVTPGIYFKLEDSTGQDILSFNGTVSPVPDSIKLRDARTGVFYPLLIATDPVGVLILSTSYARPANVTDSLIFTFGNSRPDTLLINTSLVATWRGDECPRVQSPGISKVSLRGQVLLQTTDDNSIFSIRK